MWGDNKEQERELLMHSQGFQYLEDNKILCSILRKHHHTKYNFPPNPKKKMEIAEQYPGTGIHGARTLESIRSGDFVVEYTGELISEQRRAYRSNLSYMSEVYWDNKTLFVDAAYCGNESRFINHSCDPNCYLETCDKDGLPALAIYACHNISAGTFLSFDYCPEEIEFGWDLLRGPCLCNSKICKYRQ